MEFKSVRRRKVHEDVAEQIERQILLGGLEEGDRLPSERNLMEAFNVGRPAVREALLLLQRSGFVEVSNTGRPIVARPTTTKVVEQLSGSARFLLSTKDGERAFQDARRLFEAAIARNAAEIATPQDIETLEARAGCQPGRDGRHSCVRAHGRRISPCDRQDRKQSGFHRTTLGNCRMAYKSARSRAEGSRR